MATNTQIYFLHSNWSLCRRCKTLDTVYRASQSGLRDIHKIAHKGHIVGTQAVDLKAQSHSTRPRCKLQRLAEIHNIGRVAGLTIIITMDLRVIYR